MEVNIDLDIRNFRSDKESGYTNARAANQKMYSYRFDGGTGKDGRGNVSVEKHTGNVNINITVKADRRYEICYVSFKDDKFGDLSYNPKGPYDVTIVDSTANQMDAQYFVFIFDNVANTVVECDPSIKNRPH